MLDLYRDNFGGIIWSNVVKRLGYPEVINGNNERWMRVPAELKHFESKN